VIRLSIYDKVLKEVEKTIVGYKKYVRVILANWFVNGHVLLIGVPGLAKTRLAETMAKVTNMSLSRIQFTPDLMPTDITGTEILQEVDGKRKFVFVKGPVFSNVVLADEINRTPPKTQAALLEAMQERQVTYAGKTYHLPKPFFVIATQNPIEQEGTYPLPEAELDRFYTSIWLEYPEFEDEIAIVKKVTGSIEDINPVLTKDDILFYQKEVQKVPISDVLIELAVKIVQATRPEKSEIYEVSRYVEWGAGPRAAEHLVNLAKAFVLVDERGAVEEKDIREAARWVLPHRLVLNFEAQAERVRAIDIVDSVVEKIG